MASTSGRRAVVPLTNKSGGSVAGGDVVVVDTTTDESFTTTTTAGYSGAVGVAQETIADNAIGRVAIAGYVALVNTNAAVTRGHYAFTHTVAKQATGASSRAQGAFGVFLKSSATPSAWLFGLADGSSAGLGAWTSYTPTWASSGTQPTLNDGTLEGRYKLLDANTGIVIINLKYGASTSTGTGVWNFTLPSGWTASGTPDQQILPAHILDSGTAHFAVVGKVTASATTIGAIISADATGTRIVGAGVPITWANGDELNIGPGIIELA